MDKPTLRDQLASALQQPPPHLRRAKSQPELRSSVRGAVRGGGGGTLGLGPHAQPSESRLELGEIGLAGPRGVILLFRQAVGIVVGRTDAAQR